MLYLRCNDCGEVFDEMSVIIAEEHRISDGCENEFSIVHEWEAFGGANPDDVE